VCPKCLKRHASGENVSTDGESASAPEKRVDRAGVMRRIADLRERDRRKIIRMYEAGEVDVRDIDAAIEAQKKVSEGSDTDFFGDF